MNVVARFGAHLETRSSPALTIGATATIKAGALRREGSLLVRLAATDDGEAVTLDTYSFELADGEWFSWTVTAATAHVSVAPTDETWRWRATLVEVPAP